MLSPLLHHHQAAPEDQLLAPILLTAVCQGPVAESSVVSVSSAKFINQQSHCNNILLHQNKI